MRCSAYHLRIGTLALSAAALLGHCSTSDENRIYTQEECDDICASTHAEFLASEDCEMFCEVQCLLHGDQTDFDCRPISCATHLCDAYCKDEGHLLGDCNKVTDEGIYWGCNCFD